MSRPCCQDDVCRNVEPSQEGPCLAAGGTLGPAGTCCFDPWLPGSNPCTGGFDACWKCSWEIDPQFDWLASCCFQDLDFQWIPGPPGGPGVYGEQCRACGGEHGIPEEDCEAGPPVQECIHAQDDRESYPGAPRWTLDTIGTIIFGEATVGEDYPADWPRGYHYALSTHLARPREPETPENACGHAVARLTMLDDGYCYAETCSLPDLNNLDSHRRSYGLLRTIEQTDPQIGVEAGYQYDVACIRLPAWTEALYRSHKLHCGDEPV